MQPNAKRDEDPISQIRLCFSCYGHPQELCGELLSTITVRLALPLTNRNKQQSVTTIVSLSLVFSIILTISLILTKYNVVVNLDISV